MKRFQPVKFLLVAATLAAAACSPKIDNRGYMQNGDIKEKLVIGRTTKDEVLAELGSPSSQSVFGEETWYYISSRQETVAFLKPEIAEQQVVGVHFDSSGVVSKVENFDKTAGKEFDVVKRVTPTEGHSMGIMEQFLGNIGRFNRPGGRDSVLNTPGGR